MSSPTAPRTTGSYFEAKLLDNMYDAVVFVDHQGRVTQWNHGAERLTGIAGASMRQHQWHPDLLKMTDEQGRPIAESDCPVMAAIGSGVQSLRRLNICGRNDRCLSVDCHSIPVIGPESNTLGAILQLHDASSEISLEHRCQNLAEKATRDPLTLVANRAEFDRVLAIFVNAHQQQQVPCALLMCDLDRFKQVNDVFGHQAGDEAIKSIAALLKGACNPGDFVARYGGEEFVMLCADCNITAAFRRADEIRKMLTTVPQPRMSGRTITVSFGVTEIQSGDTSETMLRRADRALLMAKENGRNQVVQLGSGSATKTRRWGATAKAEEKPDANHNIRQTLITPVPTKLAIEKLRGFVADNNAEICEIDGNLVKLEIVETELRRDSDRPIRFRLEVKFEEQRVVSDASSNRAVPGGILRTRLHVSITPSSNRDRRRDDLPERAQRVLASFRSYLMAVPEELDATPGQAKRVKTTQGILNWLRNR
jgi:diguanylate cyclase (GGDEF)-like protein